MINNNKLICTHKSVIHETQLYIAVHNRDQQQQKLKLPNRIHGKSNLLAFKKPSIPDILRLAKKYYTPGKWFCKI